MQATAIEISLILLSFLLPLAIVLPVGGVFVDRWNVCQLDERQCAYAGQFIRHSRTTSKGHLVILGLVGIGVSIILMAAFANIPVTMVATA